MFSLSCTQNGVSGMCRSLPTLLAMRLFYALISSATTGICWLAQVSLFNVKKNGKYDYLSIGEDMLPTVYMVTLTPESRLLSPSRQHLSAAAPSLAEGCAEICPRRKQRYAPALPRIYGLSSVLYEAAFVNA